MKWQEQSEFMMRLLSEAQQQMMQNWVSMVQTNSPNQADILDRQFSSTITDIWRGTIQNGLRALTLHTDPTVRDVTEKIFTSQLNMLRFLELSAQVWVQIARAMAESQDWRAVLHSEVLRIQREWLSTAEESVQLSGSFQQMWQAYLREGLPLSPLLAENFVETLANGQGVPRHQYAAFIDMTSLHWDAYPDSMGQLLYMPGLGDMQEIQEALRKSFSAWVDMQKVMMGYHAILAETWFTAFETFLLDLGQLAEAGDAVESVRDFLNRWSATADVGFKRTFQSEPYIAAQSKLLNAVMHYRQEQRQLNEIIMKLYDIPTRTEMDEAHRRIYELRKEVKSLRKEITQLRHDLDSVNRK